MAYGDSPVDEDLRMAWREFCAKLAAAGDRVFKDANPANPLQRVDGFRYLTQNLGQAFDLALETKNPKYPALYPFCSPSRKLGGDNADCVYIQAWIDGQSVYKITGKKGTARFWNITVQGPRSAIAYPGANRTLHDPFGDTPEANIFGHELVTDWDGSFELFIGGERQGQNWLPTTPGSRKLFLRQYFDDWEEESAEYRIERVGMIEPRPMPTPPEMLDAMKWAGNFVYDVVDYWPEWAWATNGGDGAASINSFTGYKATKPDDAAKSEAMDKRRGRQLMDMRWKLADDEALIIEFDNYNGFWMMTAEGTFYNSMDFLYRPISYTPSRTAVDGDGKIRLVMTKNDPGYANWIDSQGFSAGSITFRSVMSREVPQIHTTLVKAVDVPGRMHADSKKVTAEERAELMHQRFDAIRRRYRT